jgi:hypothetical protein
MKHYLRSLPLIVAALSIPVGFAQSAIVMGDIAIVGANSEGDGSIAILALNDIAGGQTIGFTDNAWVGTGFYTGSDPENPINPEGYLFYTVGATGLTAGSVVVFNSSGIIVGDMDGSILADGNFAIENDPWAAGFGTSEGLDFDQIIAFTGPTSAPDFLYALNFGNATTGWTFDEYIAPLSTSDYPTGLTEGTTSVSVVNNTWDVDETSSQFDTQDAGNLVYTGSMTVGTPAQLLAAFGNPNNWSVFSGAGDESQDLTNMSFEVIPEPTTYALLLGMLSLGLITLRRRR